MCFSDITRRGVAAQIDHYVDVLIRDKVACVMTLWLSYCYDVQKLMLAPFCLEKTSVRAIVI